MNLERLKNNKCPKCDCKLLCGLSDFYRCCACPFKIKEDRFNELVNEMYAKKNKNKVE